MRYDAILFDMDGTVIDSLPDIAAATNAALRRFAMPERSLAEIRAFVGNGASRLIHLAVPAGTAEETTEAVLRWYLPWYDAHCRDTTKPYEGILPLLDELRAHGLKLAVISNKPDAAVKLIAEDFFAGRLDLAVGETAAVRRKPWPDMIEVSAQRLGLSPARCLYVGDSEVDVLTARNAGIDCASVSWGYRSRDELRAAGAAVILDTVAALRDWILRD